MDKKAKVFQVPCVMSGCQALSGCALKMVFKTHEGMDSETMKRMFELMEKSGWLSYNVEAIEAENIVNLPKLDPKKDDGGKTPGERLRSIIYVLWQKKGQPGIFEDFRIKWYGAFQKRIKEEIERFE